MATKRRSGRKKSSKSASRLEFQKRVMLIILLCFLTSFLSLRYYKDKLSAYAANPTMHFLSRTARPAQAVAQKNDLYPSIMLAQAILESNNGLSQLSQKPYYNFFGIKGEYQGKSVILPTNEDDGDGNLYQIDAKFRQYGTATNAFKDYARVLSDPLYQKTHKAQSKSYSEASKVLTGSYATDTTYHEKLNRIISVYRLDLFDYPF